MPDPKLKVAAAEIAEICQKHDIAGVILLQSENHGEFRYHVSPSWSCMTLEADGFCRIRAKRADFPTPEAHKVKVTQTTGMVLAFLDMAQHAKEDFERIALKIGKDVCHHTTLEEQRSPLLWGEDDEQPPALLE